MGVLHKPPAVHLCVTQRHTQPGVAERFLEDLSAAVAHVRAHPGEKGTMAPVYGMADIAADPHYTARGVVSELDGVPMQGLIARLSATPGRIRHVGRPLGADTEEVLAELAVGRPTRR